MNQFLADQILGIALSSNPRQRFTHIGILRCGTSAFQISNFHPPFHLPPFSHPISKAINPNSSKITPPTFCTKQNLDPRNGFCSNGYATNVFHPKQINPKNRSTFQIGPIEVIKKAAFVKPKPKGMFKVEASLKEKAATGLAAAALIASMVIPGVAEAAGTSGLTPSLNNFLLSIAAGGVVLVVIIGVVAGVSNFDPVERA